MKDLCLAFIESSMATWNLLARAKRVGHQPGEETITDLLLLEWQEDLVPQLITVAHNKKRERSSGADWEWWFLGRSGRAIGFRIQAKVLNLKSNSFEHLHYYVNRKKPARREYQCDVLVEASRSERPTRLPLYCLYTWWQPGRAHVLGSSSRLGLVQGFGCSVMSTNAVRSLRGRSHAKALNTIKPHLVPLHTLVCPDALSSEVELPALVLEQLATAFEESEELLDAERSDAWVDYRGVEPSEAMPAYVWEMRRAEAAVAVPSDLMGVVLFEQAGEPVAGMRSG